jgi:asparagine synthase (glutamine-hydrolysing)
LLNLCNSAWADAIKDEARDRGLKVLLNAEMGNLTLSYSGEHLLPHLLAGARIARLAREALALRREGTSLRGIAAMAVGPWIPPSLWKHLARIRGTSWGLESYSALSEAGAESAGVRRRAEQRGLDLAFRPRSDGVETRLWALGRVDPGAIQKGNLAGWGIDFRDPTADRRLVEFCLRVPLDQYLSKGVFRSLARRALADRIPQAVLEERRKGYQAADWHLGLAEAGGDLREEADRIGAAAQARGLIDVDRLHHLASIPPGADWKDRRVIRSYRHILLRGLSAGHFLRRASRSNG